MRTKADKGGRFYCILWTSFMDDPLLYVLRGWWRWAGTYCNNNNNISVPIRTTDSYTVTKAKQRQSSKNNAEFAGQSQVEVRSACGPAFHSKQLDQRSRPRLAMDDHGTSLPVCFSRMNMSQSVQRLRRHVIGEVKCRIYSSRVASPANAIIRYSMCVSHCQMKQK